MKLAHPSILRVEIDPDAFVKAPQDRNNLWYLLDRLFSGEEVAEAEFEHYGLKVTLVDEFVRIERAS